MTWPALKSPDRTNGEVARGFLWSVYEDDEGTRWALQVDADYALDADRGWALVGEELLPPFPRGWRPRRVIGVDSLGATIFAIAATTVANIWTMVSTSFSFTANDASTQVASIIGREAERRSPRP